MVPKGSRFTKGTTAAARKQAYQLFIDHAQEARDVLVSIMRDPQAGAPNRIAAAKEVVTRAYGQAPQHVEITGEDGGPIEIQTSALEKLSDDQLNQLAAILKPAAESDDE